jgi:RNase P/RNase MRP subunit p30
MANILGIDIIGMDYRNKVEKNIIYRINRKQIPLPASEASSSLLPRPAVITSPSSSSSLSSSMTTTTTTTYPYLVVSEKIDELLLSSSTIDIFVVRDFKDINDNLKKKVRKKGGIGLEVILDDLRKSDGLQTGKWFNQIRDLYKFCRSSNCQFILSSGANSVVEMVSGRSFDSILRICDIKPEQYWRELRQWIESKSHTRCL